MRSISALRERLRLSLWFVPTVFAVGAFAGALISVAIDRALLDSGSFFFRFGGTAEGARNVLSTISQSMLTFTGLVFSITMLVLQLASSQLSPRVTRTFLRDRKNQVVLGLFVATFVFTLLVLREVRSPVEGADAFVPGLSVWIAFALLMTSVGAFIFYIDHMAHAIRASTVIVRIGDETRAALRRLYPEEAGDAPDAARPLPAVQPGDPVVAAGRAGVLVDVDEDALLAIAGDAARVVELIPVVGDFLPEGGGLARLRLLGTPLEAGDLEATADRIRSSVTIGEERTMQQDAAFGFRQLVDIAVRALSPGTNDPTTAVQVIDQLHDLLRRLATRAFPSPIRLDEDGRVRLVLHRRGWPDYVRLAVDEIRLAGENQIQVTQRLTDMLDDLLVVAPPARQAVLRDELTRLGRAVERGFDDPRDREAAHRSGAHREAHG